MYGWTSLLYDVPGGNQVDGLPPVASTTGAGQIWPKLGRSKSVIFDPLNAMGSELR